MERNTVLRTWPDPGCGYTKPDTSLDFRAVNHKFPFLCKLQFGSYYLHWKDSYITLYNNR